MMTEESVERKLRDIACDIFKRKPEEIGPETRFREDLGADSLDLVVLLHELENEFGVDIPDSEAARIQTFAEALRYVSSLSRP